MLTHSQLYPEQREKVPQRARKTATGEGIQYAVFHVGLSVLCSRTPGLGLGLENKCSDVFVGDLKASTGPLTPPIIQTCWLGDAAGILGSVLS